MLCVKANVPPQCRSLDMATLQIVRSIYEQFPSHFGKEHEGYLNALFQILFLDVDRKWFLLHQEEVE